MKNQNIRQPIWIWLKAAQNDAHKQASLHEPKCSTVYMNSFGLFVILLSMSSEHTTQNTQCILLFEFESRVWTEQW